MKKNKSRPTKTRIGIVAVLAIAVIAIACIIVVADPLDYFGSNNSIDHNSNSTQPPDTSTWISPWEGQAGKHFINNYTLGKSVEKKIVIHNGNSVSANFSVGYRVPDSTLEGYITIGGAAQDWVWISNKLPTIPAYGTVNVTIRLGAPSNAIIPGNKWEFWIGIIDQSQTGFIRTELCIRFLVSMES